MATVTSGTVGGSQPVTTVSAIIPARDAEAFLARAIVSTRGQCDECIVVDDASSDRTAEVAASLGAQVIRQSHGGVAAARNRGASEARGDLLAFLDADDAWLPHRIEACLDAMAGAEAVLCANRVIGDDPPMGRLVRMQPWPTTVDRLLSWEGTVVSTGSNLLIDRRAFEELTGFDETLPPVEDFDLLVRLVARGRLAYVDRPLVEYAWHDNNATRDLSRLTIATGRAYAKLAPDDRRAAAGRHHFLAAAHLRLGAPVAGLRHGLLWAAADPASLSRAAARAILRRFAPR